MVSFKEFLEYGPVAGATAGGTAPINQQQSQTMQPQGQQPKEITPQTLQAGDQISTGGNMTYPYQRPDPVSPYHILAGDDMNNPIKVPISGISAVYRGTSRIPFKSN